MHPVLFHLGSFPVHTYGALGALAFCLGAAIVIVRGMRAGHDANRVADLVFVGSIASLLGARGLYLVQEPTAYGGWWDLFDLRGGGLVFYGAFAAGLPIGTLAMRGLGLPVLATWDLVATALPVAHAVSRVGCFAAGCCHGAPTEAPWAVRYSAENGLVPHVPVHPVQLYEALALVVIGVVTNVLHGRRRFDGQVVGAYLALYAVARFGLEVFRGDPERGVWLPAVFGEALSFSQGASALVAVLAVTLLVGLGRRAASRRAVGAQIRGPTP